MKRWILCILFLFSVVFCVNTASVFMTQVDKKTVPEQILVSENANEQVISVCVAANSYADVSSQQSHSFSSNLTRRYRPGGFSVDKILDFIVVEQNGVLVSSYKNNQCSCREYFARQKLAGYYIYTLCKIII